MKKLTKRNAAGVPELNVREQLGLPLEGPLVLSKADQVRFAAATIREL